MLTAGGWGSPFDADDHTYKVFGTDKGANYSGYSNAEVDEALTKARESSDPAVRKQYYDEFQVALANNPARCYNGGEGRTKMKPLVYEKDD